MDQISLMPESRHTTQDLFDPVAPQTNYSVCVLKKETDPILKTKHIFISCYNRVKYNIIDVSVIFNHVEILIVQGYLGTSCN